MIGGEVVESGQLRQCWVMGVGGWTDDLGEGVRDGVRDGVREGEREGEKYERR